MAWASSRLRGAASNALAAAASSLPYVLLPKHALTRCEEAQPGTANPHQKVSLINHGPLKIFTGNAHRALAEGIADCMQVKLSSASVDRFSCGEVSVMINESVRDCDVFIVQPTCNGGGGPQEHLVELLIMIDAVRRSAAHRITAVIPHFGYARQSAKEQSRTPISAKLVTDMLQVAGANRVMTVELHVPQIQGFAAYPVDNLYALDLLAKEVESIMASRGLVADDIVVVSPDVGGAKRAAAMAKRLCAPLAIFSKQRRRATQKKELDLVGEVEGKTCIIIDDVADTTKTVCDAADTLLKRGAQNVIGTVIHGVLSDPAVDTINKSGIEVLIVTDTIPLDEKVARCPKLRVISVAPLLGSAIQRVHQGESLSALFEDCQCT
jgi:ribose-phosphate pyrophosphokinase